MQNGSLLQKFPSGLSMPTYNFKNKETGEIIEKRMYMADREKFLEENPEFEQVHLSGLNAVSGVSIKNKVPDGFRDVLKNIKSNHYKSTIDI